MRSMSLISGLLTPAVVIVLGLRVGSLQTAVAAARRALHRGGETAQPLSREDDNPVYGSGGFIPAGSSGRLRRCRAALTGRPASHQALNPPITSPERVNPRSASTAAARMDEHPWSQIRMVCCSTSPRDGFRNSLSGAVRHSSTVRGIWSEPGTIPSSERSLSERMSIRIAPFSIAVCVSAGERREIRASASARRSARVRRLTLAFIDQMMC